MKLLTRLQNSLTTAMLISAGWLYSTIAAADTMGQVLQEGYERAEQQRAQEIHDQNNRMSGSRGPATNNQDIVDQMRNKDPDPNAPAVLPTVDTYIAVVLHPDADEPWAIWNTQDKDVGKRVLDACKEAMGDKKCKVTAQGKNTAVAIGYVNNHLTETATGETPWIARKNLKEKCSNCVMGVVFAAHPVIRTDFVDADIKGYLPSKEAVRLKSQNLLNVKEMDLPEEKKKSESKKKGWLF